MCNTTRRPRYAILFLIVLTVYSFIFMGYQIFAIRNLNSSQERIKNCYIEHIEKVDSLYCGLNSCNKSILSRYMQDTVYNNQMDLLYREYQRIVKEDSLRLCNERLLVETQTKAMIDLHLNKVEHEYSNLTIWAAILTILFLVFSFYSIYKMDELIQQGNDGVKDIRSLKKKSEDIIDNLENASKVEIAKTRNQIDEFIKEQQGRMLQTLNYFESENANKINEINKCYVDACTFVEQIKEFKSSIENDNKQSNN